MASEIWGEFFKIADEEMLKSDNITFEEWLNKMLKEYEEFLDKEEK